MKYDNARRTGLGLLRLKKDEVNKFTRFYIQPRFILQELKNTVLGVRNWDLTATLNMLRGTNTLPP